MLAYISQSLITLIPAASHHHQGGTTLRAYCLGGGGINYTARSVMRTASEYRIKKNSFHYHTVCGPPLPAILVPPHLIAIHSKKELVLVGTSSGYFFIIRRAARDILAACGKFCVGAED